MITVRDLVADPALSLGVISGHDGLDRQLSWTHISEFTDVSRWLEGGELLLSTGSLLPPDPESQVRYLSSLDRAGVVCLGLGQRTPPLADAFLGHSDATRIPIVRVGAHVPFSRLSRTVAAANLDESQNRLTMQVRVLESLRFWSEGISDASGVFKRLEAVTGYDIYVVDSHGHAVIDGWRDCDEATAAQLPLLAETPVIGVGYGAPVPSQGPDEAYVVLQHRVRKADSGVVIARQVATVAAVVLADDRRREAEALQRDAEVLSGLLRSSIPAQTAERHLRSRGFDLQRPLRILALCDDQELSRHMLHQVISGLRHPSVASMESDHVVVLTQIPLDILKTRIGALSLRGGVSEGFAWGSETQRFARQAAWSLARATQANAAFVTFDDADQYAPWSHTPVEVREQIVQRVLGPMLAADHERGSDLMSTLSLYLEMDRSAARTAEALFIHPHTLRYRLNKIEELCGLKLSSTSDLATVWFAVQAWERPH